RLRETGDILHAIAGGGKVDRAVASGGLRWPIERGLVDTVVALARPGARLACHVAPPLVLLLWVPPAGTTREPAAGFLASADLAGMGTVARPHVREFHDLGELLGLAGDEPAEVGWRARQRRAAELGEPRFDLGIIQRGVDLAVELVDDGGGRALRHAEAPPVA